jgi:hypothetical protein
MTLFRLAPATWKWFNAALAVLLAVMMLSDVGHAIRPMLIEGMQGTLGAQLDDEFSRHAAPPGSHFLHIQSFSPQSPLEAAGAQVGDTLRFDNHLNRWTRFAIGDQVGVTLYHEGVARHVQVTAAASPVPFADYFEYSGRVLLCLAALLFCLMVGFKQGEHTTYRYLSRTFLGCAALFFINFHYTPPSLALQLGKLAGLGLFPLLWYWCVRFALSWQPYRASRLRHALNAILPFYRVLTFTASAYSCWWALGKEAPLLGLFILLSATVGVVLVMASLLEGWSQSSGEVRQRHLWMVMSFTASAVPGTAVWIPAFDWEFNGIRVALMAAVIGNLVMYCGLAYAVLRHRIFHFEFAVNRAMVYSVVSVLLLCTVGLLEFLSKSLLKGGGHEHKSLLIDAGIALGVYLIFHQLHGRIEKWVEKVFFFKWHDNEHKLRHYVKQAAHFTEVEPLLSSFRTAIDRFTGHAGCAVYLRQASGNYALVGGTMPEAPTEMDPNHVLVVALRADMAPTPLETSHSVPGALVLPMSHRGTLNGYVLVEAKSRGESYRPDEIEVMAFTAHQIGLDIHALRVEALEVEVRTLELQAEQQRRELELMAGRRKNARSLAGAEHDLQSST